MTTLPLPDLTPIARDSLQEVVNEFAEFFTFKQLIASIPVLDTHTLGITYHFVLYSSNGYHYFQVKATREPRNIMWHYKIQRSHHKLDNERAIDMLLEAIRG